MLLNWQQFACNARAFAWGEPKETPTALGLSSVPDVTSTALPCLSAVKPSDPSVPTSL